MRPMVVGVAESINTLIVSTVARARDTPRRRIRRQ
jgi:hypothetical protein